LLDTGKKAIHINVKRAKGRHRYFFPLCMDDKCSYYVLIMDKKKQLANVAFGGNWSEEILRLEDLRTILGVIDKAVEDCMARDVEDEGLHQAMLYIRKNVEKGPMLCEAFFKALKIKNQNLRHQRLQEVGNMIRMWAGV